jgi:TPR repeat protein
MGQRQPIPSSTGTDSRRGSLAFLEFDRMDTTATTQPTGLASTTHRGSLSLEDSVLSLPSINLTSKGIELSGDDDTENGTTIATLLEKDQDTAEFFYDLGKRLLLGKEGGMEVHRDPQRAVYLLIRAAELGHRGAQWDLQCCEGDGSDIKLNYAKAVEIYTRYALQNDPIALSNLGVCYHKGRGTRQDLKKAAQYYAKAADLNYSRGNYNLGVCYDLGEGVPLNVTKAVEHYNRAAMLGYAVGQYYMGVCHQHSKGLPNADLHKAVDLWKKAAEQGHALAQALLAGCYKEGLADVITKDLLMAAHWYLSAASWGDVKAWEKLKDLLKGEAFEERKLGMDKYKVANLYDQCCLIYHKKWLTYRPDPHMHEAQSKIPPEITERIKYKVKKCIHPSCQNVFFGCGRFERRFMFKALQNEECLNIMEKDIVLSFCSIRCSQLE